MKQLTIIYDSSIDASVTELLDALELAGMTTIYDVEGRGGRGPKMNNPVYPGTNNLILLAVTPEDAERVRRSLRRLQSSYRLKPGVTILSQDVEVLP